MRRKVRLLVLILSLVPFVGLSKSHKVSFFSPKSFYVYATGSWVYNIKPDYHNISAGHREKANAFVPFVGVGYTILNLEKKIRVNLEFDYASADFDFPGTPGRQIEFYTFMANVEIKISDQFPFWIYSGFGLSGIDYSQNDTFSHDEIHMTSRNDSEPRVPLSFGVKFSLTEHLMLRAEARNYTFGIGDNGCYYYYIDDTPVYYNPGDSSLGSALAFGLEYHF